jgi:hypothetical protein
MKTLLLPIVLAVLLQSKGSEQKTTEQSCTEPALVGTWQLVKSGDEARSGDAPTALKHVTPTHFFVLSVDATGLASYGHGGPYTLSAGIYTESIVHGFGAPFSQIRGTKVSFKCGIDKDVWHITGEIGGQTFDEQWKRVSPAGRK